MDVAGHISNASGYKVQAVLDRCLLASDPYRLAPILVNVQRLIPGRVSHTLRCIRICPAKNGRALTDAISNILKFDPEFTPSARDPGLDCSNVDLKNLRYLFVSEPLDIA